MGLGKTYTGSEKLMRLGAKVNLVVCQKSKVNDWVNHFTDNYPVGISLDVWNLTSKGGMEAFLSCISQVECGQYRVIGVINYELAWRRKDLLKLTNFTLMLDESSMIQNEQAKRSKFILKMKPTNVILLSGTPVAGRYERLWSQLHLLGWEISKTLYYQQYVQKDYVFDRFGQKVINPITGRPVQQITGYKNVDRLKAKLREHGARFLQTEDVMDLPEQVFSVIKVPVTKEYKKFRRARVITINTGTLAEAKDTGDAGDPVELVGDMTLTKMLYERQLCGQYNADKLGALRDLLQSSDDRMIVFYNFNADLAAIERICQELERPLAVVNGSKRDLVPYEEHEDSVTAVQYQAGAMGLNLQKANKLIYFSPPISCEHWMQSKKRINRIGQTRTCFYYQLVVENSVEEKIYNALARDVDYTEKLFDQE